MTRWREGIADRYQNTRGSDYDHRRYAIKLENWRGAMGERREATLSQFRGRFATVESLKARNGGVAALPCL